MPRWCRAVAAQGAFAVAVDRAAQYVDANHLPAVAREVQRVTSGSTAEVTRVHNNLSPRRRVRTGAGASPRSAFRRVLQISDPTTNQRYGPPVPPARWPSERRGALQRRLGSALQPGWSHHTIWHYFCHISSIIACVTVVTKTVARLRTRAAITSLSSDAGPAGSERYWCACRYTGSRLRRVAASVDHGFLS
jgi:hypothetical protein